MRALRRLFAPAKQEPGKYNNALWHRARVCIVHRKWVYANRLAAIMPRTYVPSPKSELFNELRKQTNAHACLRGLPLLLCK
jgi:uncharacterized membrane protein YdfJ with MMPL/SSD domain